MLRLTNVGVRRAQLPFSNTALSAAPSAWQRPALRPHGSSPPSGSTCICPTACIGADTKALPIKPFSKCINVCVIQWASSGNPNLDSTINLESRNVSVARNLSTFSMQTPHFTGKEIEHGRMSMTSPPCSEYFMHSCKPILKISCLVDTVWSCIILAKGHQSYIFDSL